MINISRSASERDRKPYCFSSSLVFVPQAWLASTGSFLKFSLVLYHSTGLEQPPGVELSGFPRKIQIYD